MIRIARPAAPAKLTGDGAERTQLLCEAYDEDQAYAAGTKTFDITSDVYGHPSVKSALLTAQHQKCCYCERKILATGYGDVEHHRPKAAVRQDETAPAEKPGYYWLGYAWSNLLVSCSVCNTSWKQIFFPLENPADRARSHHAAIGLERPGLLDPAAEDPREHIRFAADAPFALSARGQLTIDRLGLTRGDLVEARLSLYATLVQLRSVIVALPLGDPDRAAALAFIHSRADASQEFSSMVIDFIADQVQGL